MGAVKRDRQKKEREREKADMYCGCLMTEKRRKGQQHKGECGRRRYSDKNEKTRGEEKCEKGNSVTSKKPVAADTELGTDSVSPPLWVNNHHKPWLCLMNPLPMS